MEWISVKDRLPEFTSTSYTNRSDRVLVFNGFYTSVGTYTETPHGGTKKSRIPRWESYGRIADGITHWMPLPEPPKD